MEHNAYIFDIGDLALSHGPLSEGMIGHGQLTTVK